MNEFKIRIETGAPSPDKKPSSYVRLCSSLPIALKAVHELAEKTAQKLEGTNEVFGVFADWNKDGRIIPGLFAIVSGRLPDGSLKLSEVVSLNPATTANPRMLATIFESMKNPYLAEVAARPGQLFLFSFPNLKEGLREHFFQMNKALNYAKENAIRMKSQVSIVVWQDGIRVEKARIEGWHDGQNGIQFILSLHPDASDEEKEEFDALTKQIQQLGFAIQTALLPEATAQQETKQ